MAFPIPKIEYLNDTTTGSTTSGSGVITTVADLSKVKTGMRVTGAGIPADAVVGPVGPTSFTLLGGLVASATAALVPLTFWFEISFDYPPVEKKGPRRQAQDTTSTSISGIRQVSVSHLEERRTLELSFLAPAIFILVDQFITNHALYGRPFKYFEDKTLPNFTSYEMDNLDYDPERITSRSATEFVWRVPFTMRRAL